MIRIALGITVVSMTLLGSTGCLQPGTLSNDEKHNSNQPERIVDDELKSAVVEYINGKELKLDDKKTITIESKNVTAFQLDPTRSQVNDGPWEQEGTFLYRNAEQSYAVRFEVSFRKVEGEYAFFGFKVDQAVKQ